MRLLHNIDISHDATLLQTTSFVVIVLIQRPLVAEIAVCFCVKVKKKSTGINIYLQNRPFQYNVNYIIGL